MRCIAGDDLISGVSPLGYEASTDARIGLLDAGCVGSETMTQTMSTNVDQSRHQYLMFALAQEKLYSLNSDVDQ